MRLTRFTDYSLRTLIYLGLCRDGLATIQAVSDRYAISRNHLMKVAHALSRAGYVVSVRGKNGGLKLALAPSEISVGAVVRELEAGSALVECFDPDRSQCRIDGACALKGMLGEAHAAFLGVLDRYTLADVLAGEAGLNRALFGVDSGDRATQERMP